MKLLETIGLNSLLTKYLREEITKVILDRYKTDSIENLPKDVFQEARLMIKQLLSQEHLKVKKNWKEFKKTIEPLERKALKIALLSSSIHDYYIEQSTDIIAVPKEYLKSLASKSLRALLEEKMQLEDMENATIIALTKYAIDMRIDKIFKAFKEEKEFLSIENSIYILADEIDDDLYYINDNTSPTRNSMLFFASVEDLSLNFDKKEIEERCQEASEKWERFNKKRPDNKRFIFKNDRISWDTPAN